MTLTAKQEKFCQAIVSGMNQSDAYRAAYSAGKMKLETVTAMASTLAADHKIARRVAELRKPVIEAMGLTLEQHLADLKTLRDRAAEEGKWGPAVSAEMGRGKAAGHHITRIEDVTDPLKKAIGNMPADRAQAMIDALEQMQAIQAKANHAA